MLEWIVLAGSVGVAIIWSSSTRSPRSGGRQTGISSGNGDEDMSVGQEEENPDRPLTPEQQAKVKAMLKHPPPPEKPSSTRSVVKSEEITPEGKARIARALAEARGYKVEDT